MVCRESGVDARGEYTVAGVGDEDEQADYGDEGAYLRERSGLAEELARVRHHG
jgi:hypothetical protein